MVNDLEPCKESGDPAGNSQPGKDGKPTIPRKALPLSIERTNGIIENCVSSYLRKLLEGPGTRPLPIGNPNGRQLRPGSPSSQSPSQPGYLSDPRFAVDPQNRIPSGPSSAQKSSNGTHNASSYPTSYLSPFGRHGDLHARARSNSDVQNGLKADRPRQYDPEAKDRSSRPTIFRPLEDYIITSFRGCDCLNASFTTSQPSRQPRETSPAKPTPEPRTIPDASQTETDAKTLLLGDLTENSSWLFNDGSRANVHAKDMSFSSSRPISSRSPRINWTELTQWYNSILTAGTSWVEQWSMMQPANIHEEEDAARRRKWDSMDLSFIDREISDARLHLHRTLLKATENLLKRPRRPLKKAEEARFLLMLLSNPLIYSSGSPPASPTAGNSPYRDDRRPSNGKDPNRLAPGDPKSSSHREPSKHRSRGLGQHSGIVKRILGLIANMPADCHHYLIAWFSRFSPGQLEKLVELIGSFVTYRLTRQHGRKRSETFKTDNSLIPSFSSAAGNTPAELHAAINGRTQNKSGGEKKNEPAVYGEDWQIRTAARVMSLLFAANNIVKSSRKADCQEVGGTAASRYQPSRHDHIIPISCFYNTLLDYSDLVADFEAWEGKTSKFSFCQYPFFLSIWAKIHIMEYDARRQMEVKAREAFFNSILSRKAVSQYLVLKVRRDCLVEDSLRSVSEVVWSSQQEIKKGLRIEFIGEEGVDAGGLRKEWFLLLVREVFDPNHGEYPTDGSKEPVG